jgi:hypothetical protein
MEALLDGPSYKGLTVDEIIKNMLGTIIPTCLITGHL